MISHQPSPYADMVTDACWFEVAPANLLGSGKLPPYDRRPGFLEW